MEKPRCGQLVCEMKNEPSHESLPFLSDKEVREITAPLRRPAAMVRWFKKHGFEVRPRPNGMPLVSRTNFENVMRGGARKPDCAAHDRQQRTPQEKAPNIDAFLNRFGTSRGQ
jgi:hypothetical protein